MSNRNQNAIGTEIVRAGCRKFPSAPSLTLARKLFAENKGVFPSLKAVRSSIMYHRGRCGCHGKLAKNPIASTAPNVAHNPWRLPKSEESSFESHVVTVEKQTKALVLSDIHVPYHNVPALRAALAEGKKEKCSHVILNGDTLDFHRLSRFQKDPRSRSVKEEILRANQLLDAIDQWFPTARKIWKNGNHDERYDNYLAAVAVEVFDLVQELCSLPKLLRLEERGWEYVTDKRPIQLGSLTMIHGHEYPTPVLGPVNAARGLFLRAMASSIVGHHHQTSEHTARTINGDMITAWSTGCLCELHPMYARFNKWNHGAAIISLSKSGAFSVRNFRIANGKLLN